MVRLILNAPFDDCIREIGQVFGADALLAHCKSMQKLTSATFKAAMSPLAQKE